MKTHLTYFRVTGILFAAALLIGPVLGQQPGMPRVNPVTGLPLSSSGDLTNLPPINPLTGLPKLPGMLTPADAITEVYQVANEVERLSFNHKYDEALKACLAFRKKWRTSASLIPLLPKWVELGRRYPAARAALEELRDRDTREFEEGRGSFALFLEVHWINHYLGQEDATYRVFQQIRDKDPRLAAQCYGMVESLLVAHGEYQYCYDHMPDPQARFDVICRDLKERLDRYAHSEAMSRRIREQIAEKNLRLGFTNSSLPSPPFSPQGQLQTHATNTFVGQTRQLVEILVGTGHKAEAEQIVGQALNITDDSRLKSAIADALTRFKR